MSRLRSIVSKGLRPVAAGYYRSRPGIRVLMYHRVRRTAGYDQLTVSPDRFREQMAYLAEQERPLSLKAALDELAVGIQRPGVVVTFDDGYLDNLTEALPTLERFDIPATIYVTTSFCAQQMRHRRYAAETQRLHLDWDECRLLSKHPLIDIGSHAVTHASLSQLPGERSGEEIRRSRDELMSRLGRAVDAFCYPSGDLGRREITLVREAGYRSAVTVQPGLNRSLANPFELRRTEVTDRDDAAALSDKLAGAYDLPHSLLHWRRTRRQRRAAEAAHHSHLKGRTS